MLPRQSLVIFGVTIVMLVGAVACAASAVPSQAPGVAAAAPTAQATSPVSSQGEGIIVDVTPMSPTELASQPTGKSDPGAGTENGVTPTEPGPQAGNSPSGKTVVYADSAYKFSVSYPDNFVFRAQTAEKLAQLTPKPTASFIFMNPVTAASQVPDEPADLEIRAYSAGQTNSLDSWLRSNGLLPADSTVPVKPFKTAGASGVEVCPSTMIAPGCSYFVLGTGWIYQLTPATLEGETMVKTFTLIP